MTDPEPVVCTRCGGAGEVWWNPTWTDDPKYDVSRDCRDCDGTGVVEPDAS